MTQPPNNLQRHDTPSQHSSDRLLSDAQLASELAKCEYCEEKPCQQACPCDCSPADFIKAIEVGAPEDFQRSAALIMTKNPLGGICGMVCPDRFCMAACVHRELDGPVRIPDVQAAIVARAKAAGTMPALTPAPPSGKRVAVVGSGPAGLAAALSLAQRGHRVILLEREAQPGGMCRCIPDFRLDKDVLQSDIAWVLEAKGIELQLDAQVAKPEELLTQGYDAVVVATGLWTPLQLKIPGEELALPGIELLAEPSRFDLSGRQVAVIGGGATAFDCAQTARLRGAARVEMFALENLSEMPLTARELGELTESGIDASGRTRVSAIEGTDGAISGIRTIKVQLAAGQRFSPQQVQDVPGSEALRQDIDTVVIAIGLRSEMPRGDDPRVVWAGDCAEGPTTVVEASASGKNAAERVCALLAGQPAPKLPARAGGPVKSTSAVPGYNFLPVPLETEFFGRTIRSPFLLSAAPPTDGLEQMERAYAAGWAGGIMKTAFDGVPIHIPAEYMFTFDRRTYANCDNVSGHALARVCREIGELVRRYPDRLTIGSTGGPVTGDDAADRAGWQSNTSKLENAGAMAIEYSLSCPQGGDGTEGDIVSQNAELAAKIVDWVLAGGSGQVPKLFKLTGAVTSVAAIVTALQQVFARHPDKAAGITLANSFPTLAFRPGSKPGWEEGVVVGASGAGILNISYLSLAKVAHLGVHISGNGGPMDYKAAANFLALGTRTVQFCTLVMKYGYGIIDELHAGLSHLMAARGLEGVEQLIGAALPGPVRDFMELSAEKKVSAADPTLCLRCGNCTRCPYLAISLGEDGFPVTDPARCVGCSICSLKCFAGAIGMRQRSAAEAAALKES